MKYFIFLLMLFGSTTTELVATDIEREERLAQEFEANLFDGDVIYLSDGNQDFVSAYMEAEDSRGSVLLLHGRGFHPDWQDVVGPVRVSLAENGWTTLSIQMPVLEKGRKYYDYVKLFPESYKRIESAIQYLRENTKGPIVLLAHSCGAHMAMNWIDETGDALIDAYIGVGMGATDYKQDLIRPFPLDKMSVPILDILGTKEYPRVLALAEHRKKILNNDMHPQSQQIYVENADHYFKNKNTELYEEIATWLNNLRF